MAKKTPIENMDKAIAGILNDYADDVNDMMGEIVPKVAKQAARALKGVSPKSKKQPKNRKHYADNWDVDQTVKSRMVNISTVYNKSPTYRVSHLLEHGHAKRGGGRVEAITHIKPVEDQVIRSFSKEVQDGL